MINLKRYFELMDIYPHEFINNNELLKIVTDKNIISSYIKENDVEIGVVYESKYHTLVVDLVVDNHNNYFLYDRIICEKNAVIIIPHYKDKYILLKQYRHSLRDYQYSFPRGFGEPGLTSKDNAIKELKEEINAEISDMRYLSNIVSNSGIAGNKVDVYIAEVEGYSIEGDYEGIESAILVNESELEHMISSGDINDAMTLSSLLIYWTNKK